MNQPLVSIIVPVYNAATLLARCIDSIRFQSYENLEILLINDGSTDASRAICEMYARVDERIRFIDRSNRGVSATRNHAINLAEGVYLQFVDSDDWLDEHATRMLVERAESTNADLVIAHYCRVEGDGNPEVCGFINQRGPITKRMFAEHLMDEPASFYYGVMWNKLYRRSIIQAHGIECDESLRWSEDFLFNLEYIRWCETFAAVQTPMYYYVKNRTGLTSKVARAPIRTLQTRQMLFEYYKELYQELGLYEENKLQIHKYLIANTKNG